MYLLSSPPSLSLPPLPSSPSLPPFPSLPPSLLLSPLLSPSSLPPSVPPFPPSFPPSFPPPLPPSSLPPSSLPPSPPSRMRTNYSSSQVMPTSSLHTPSSPRAHQSSYQLPPSRSFSRVAPTSTSDNEITYGPYSNMDPYSNARITIHYENNGPFLTVASLDRLIEISHWGNLAVEEHVHVKHTGEDLPIVSLSGMGRLLAGSWGIQSWLSMT